MAVGPILWQSFRDSSIAFAVRVPRRFPAGRSLRPLAPALTLAQARKGGPARGPNIPLVDGSRGAMFRAGILSKTSGRPPPPALRSSGGTPARRKPVSAFLADPSLPRLGAYSAASLPYGARVGPERHAGSGGAPRLPEARETEARPMPFFAWDVNTEGPGPQGGERVAAGGLKRRAERACFSCFHSTGPSRLVAIGSLAENLTRHFWR